MAQTVRDTAVQFEILSGARVIASLENSVSELKVGLPGEGFFQDLQPDVEFCVSQALRDVKALVSEIRQVPIKVSSRRTVFDAEIYEYHQEMLAAHPELYDPQTLARISGCAGISATDYIRAQRELIVERREAELAFEEVDVVITPTVPISAPMISDLTPLGEPKLREFEKNYLLRNTLPFSVVYWPSVSVPCGFTREGLPVGMQISGKPGGDATVLRLAYAYEQATEWHKRRPQL